MLTKEQFESLQPGDRLLVGKTQTVTWYVAKREQRLVDYSFKDKTYVSRCLHLRREDMERPVRVVECLHYDQRRFLVLEENGLQVVFTVSELELFPAKIIRFAA